MARPFERFLGVSPNADAFRLLALTPGQTHRKAIQRALEAQLARIDRHPDGGSREADYVRARLREAARAAATGAQFVAGGVPQAQHDAANVQHAPRKSARGAPPVPGKRVAPSKPNPQKSGRQSPAQPDTRRPPAAPRTSARTPVKPPRTGGTVDKRRDESNSRNGNAVATRLELTSFDRQVLAVLVACGGWNAESRGRLVALAGANYVSPKGLMKVVRGLSEYAASKSETQIDLQQISQGHRLQLDDLSAPRSDASLDEEAWRKTQERRVVSMDLEGPWATIKLSLLFGSATILLGILFMNLLLGNEQVEPPVRETPERIAARVDEQLDRAVERASRVADEDSGRGGESSSLDLALFEEPPTFNVPTASDVSLDAAEQALRFPGRFASLEQKLLGGAGIDQTFWTDYRLLHEQAGLAWPLLDAATFNAMRDAAVDVVAASVGRPGEAEKLIQVLVAQTQGATSTTDFWSGAWAAGMLGELAGSGDTPPLAKDIARRGLENALAVQSDRSLLIFDEAARRWLDARIPRMVSQTPFDDETYTTWEHWIQANRALRERESLNRSALTAIEQILATPVDLARPGPMVNVLGRLLSLLDFRRSQVVKERVLAMYDNPAFESRDLWVLGSILASFDAAPWFTEDLVVDDGATMQQRVAARSAVASNWPAVSTSREALAAGQGIVIDRRLGERWQMLTSEHLQKMDSSFSGPQGVDVTLLERLVLTSWLNEAAAALAVGNIDAADQVLTRFERGWTPDAGFEGHIGAGGPPPLDGEPRLPPNAIDDPTRGSPMAPRSTPVKNDGEWKQRLNQAQSGQERLEWLQLLRTESGSDLGPSDASTFVQLLYRGSPARIRIEARKLLLEKFRFAPNVTVALLNHFVDAPKNGDIHEMLVSLTGEPLPGVHTDAWNHAARLALTRHAVALMSEHHYKVNRLVRAVAESYTEQDRHLKREMAGMDFPDDPNAAVARLITTFRSMASKLVVASPVTGSISDIERRLGTRLTLARGPVQEMVASQVAASELLGYVIAAEQPVRSPIVQSILQEAQRKRSGASHVLEQAVLTEMAMVDLWRNRLVLDQTLDDEPNHDQNDTDMERKP